MTPRSPGLVPIVTVDPASPVPRYRQLYEGIRDAIVERRLRPGQRLPSTRALAVELGLSRFPVLAAYEQLLAEGYVKSGVGAGTFVSGGSTNGGPAGSGRSRARSGRRAPRRVCGDTDFLVRRAREPWLAGHGAFRVSQPEVARFPHVIWARLLARAAHDNSAEHHYGDAMGHLQFREAIAEYLRTTRAVRCESDQVMVVSGSQHALNLITQVVVSPGSAVWIEEPGYGGVRDVLRLRGARLVPVPVDGEGLDVAAGIARCRGAAAAYVTPSHQYPLGAVMSAPRRLELLDWAERAGAWIIEDDYDSEYRYDSQPIASLQGLDGDARVLYVGTFSKVLFPSLRLGYIVVPRDLIDRFRVVRDANDIFPPVFMQRVLAAFVGEGHFARHLRRMRSLYANRRATLVAEIEARLGNRLEILAGAAGLHLVAALRRGGDDQAAARRAARRRLWAMPLSSCYLGDPSSVGFVLGFGGTGIDQIADGVDRLKLALG